MKTDIERQKLVNEAGRLRIELEEAIADGKPFDKEKFARAEHLLTEADASREKEALHTWVNAPRAGQQPPPAVPAARESLRPDTEYDIWRAQQAAITGAEGYRDALSAYIASAFRPNLYGPKQQDVLQGGIDELGGFLLTEDFVTGIFGRKATPSHVFDAIARRPTNRESVTIRVWQKDPTDPSEYNSNIIPTWVAEIPASGAGEVTPKVGLVKVSVDKGRIKIPISRDELADTDLDLLSELEKAAGPNIRAFIDRSIISGSGVDQPLGFLNDTAIIDNAAATDVSGTTVDEISNSTTDLGSATKIMDLQATLPVQYRERAVWIMSPDSENRTRQLIDAQSRFIWGEGFSQTPGVLLGSPVIISPWMQDGGTDGNILLVYGDLEECYQGVIRESIAAQLDPFSKADVEQVELYLRFRFGGRVKNVDAVRLGKV